MKPPPTPKPRAASSAEREHRRVITPPAGVAAQLAAPLPIFEGDKTNPHAPLLDQVDDRTKRIDERAKSISLTAVEQLKRLENVEATQTALVNGHKILVGRLNQQDAELAEVKKDAAYTRGKIDVIADNAKAQVDDRAAARAHALKREKLRQGAKLVAAIGGLLAAAAAVIAALAQVL